MKRSLVAIALLACSLPEGVQTPDASVPVSISVTLLDKPILVARGESAKIRISIAGATAGATTFTIGLGPLPQGLSAPPITWSTLSSTQPTIVVSAAPDAPQAQLGFEVRVFDQGTIIGSTSGQMSISNVVGSPDPQFGTNGVVQWKEVPLTQPAGIAPAANGTFVVGGFDVAGRRAVAIRILADGTLDTSYANKGVAAVTPITSPQWPGAMAAAVDGRVAISLTSGAGEVDTIDANGSPIATVAVPFAPTCLAWDGDGLFVGGSGALAYIDASQTLTTMYLQRSVLSLQVVAPGTVLAGVGINTASVQKWLFSAGKFSPDTTYGQAGNVTLTANASVVALATDANGQTLAAIASTSLRIARLDPNGMLDTTYGANGIALTSPSQTATANLLATPDGNALVMTTVPSTIFPMGATLLARLTSTGQSDTSFGTYGGTTTGLASGTRATGLVLDSNATHVYVTGMVDDNGGASGYVARYRL